MIAVDVPMTADAYFLRTVYTAKAPDAVLPRILLAALCKKIGAKTHFAQIIAKYPMVFVSHQRL
ncbi:hypothetical protein GCM10022405_46410 [Gibbsiella dentisursi]|uniref:Uncharacterized protein n=1 Tax=Gibbsiella dentisursi TaxID=796890 RepID=A0ABP7M617_9GAMM